MNEDLKITNEWDKTFELSEKVNHKKVTFHTRFGFTLVADQYEPKNYEGKLPAISVCGPFGAVKEQCSGLYAMKMAERGFLTIAFDPSFTGESSGTPRYVASPDINTEDFQASIDYLSTLENVDSEKISIIGICGWGGLALNVASIDTRIKATVCSTMYNMSKVNHDGYFNSNTEDSLYELKENLNKQRIEDYKNNDYKLGGGCLELPVPEDSPFFVKDYSEYYKGRAYHERSLNSNGGWNMTSALSFINTPEHTFSKEIRNAVLIIHGEKAHSCYFSKEAYEDMVKDSKYTDNRELMIIPGAVHTDLYDNLEVIPFDKIEDFIRKNISSAYPLNDGKQTPMKNHPVFIAQHACGCCCRGCLEKWHNIPKGRELKENEITYLVALIIEWIKREYNRKKEI